jgi:ABC-2 type transport system permease protein
MSIVKTLATAGRVLRQLRHDPRTIALILLVPCFLMWLLSYIFDGQPDQFNHIAPIILGIFPLLMMFLVTSIVTLRERTTGVLDRLMTMPMSKLDLLFGYGIAFSLVGLIQAILVGFVTFKLLNVTIDGPFWMLLIAVIAAAFLGTTMGLFVSAFARSEFQAVQLVMPILMPQVLLCGLFIPIATLDQPLQWISYFLPLTYSVDAMQQVANHASWTGDLTKDLVIVVTFGILALVLGSLTIRRQES